MQNTDIYLIFNGDCEAAFKFYKTVFGGEFIATQRYGEMPGSDKMKPEDYSKIMHISLKLTPATTLMGSDIIAKDHMVFVQGNNYHICLNADSEKEADRLFDALSADGKIEMPMNKTFWGAYFGMCCDSFGTQWMISYAQPQP